MSIIHMDHSEINCILKEIQKNKDSTVLRLRVFAVYSLLCLGNPKGRFKCVLMLYTIVAFCSIISSLLNLLYLTNDVLLCFVNMFDIMHACLMSGVFNSGSGAPGESSELLQGGHQIFCALVSFSFSTSTAFRGKE